MTTEPRPPAPPTTPPPTPPDFEETIKEWEEKAKEHMELAQQSEVQLRQLGQEYERLSQREPPGWVPSWLRWMPGIGYAAYGPWGQAGLMSGVKSRIEIVETELERYDFYARLYYQAPMAIMGRKVANADDVLALLQPPRNTSPTELEEITNLIDSMFDVIVRPLPEMALEGAPPILPALVAPPTVVEAPPNTIQRLTIDAIVRQLTTPEIPPSIMTEEEWTDFMIESGQISSKADLESVAFLESEATRIVDEWQERNNMLEAYRANIAEMPDYGAVDFLKELVVMPGMALLQVGQLYFEHVSQPLAGLVYGPFIPDLDAAFQRYRKTEGTWQALGHSWEEWDAPGEGAAEWILKYMLMEGLVDPLTYVGWGIATRIAKPLGGFGRLVGYTERGLAQVFEIPFDLIKAGLRKIPKTVGQQATIKMAKAGQYVDKYMTQRYGKALYQMTMEEWTDGVQFAVRHTLNNPQVDDVITRAGKELMDHTPMTRKQVWDWAQRLETTLRPEDVTKQTVDSVDQLFETFFRHSGFKKKLIVPKEAADELVRTLYGRQTDDISTLASKLLLERRSGILASARSFGQLKTPFKAVRQLMRRNYDNYVATEASEVALAKIEMGRISTLLTDTPVRIQRVWARSIDAWIVKPFAQSYLTFALYGPMNVIEDVIRTTLGGVVPGRRAPQTFMRKWAGVSYDREILRDAASETLGFMTLQSPTELNNWILQLGGLAKGFGSKTYRVLVEYPGQIGISIRRHFLDTRATQILKEMGGESFENLARVGPDKLMGVTDKKIIREVQQAAMELKIQGLPDALRAAKDDFTRVKIIRREVDNILKEHPDLPTPVRDFLMRQQDEGIIFREGGESINRVVREADDVLIDDFIASPERASAQYEQLADFLTQLEVRNPQEMAQLIQSLNLMSSVAGATPKQILARATERTRGLALGERRASIDKALDSISIFRERANASMDRVVERIKVQMRGEVRLGTISPNTRKDWLTTTTDISIYDNLLNNPQYYATEKGMQGRLMEISPDEALQMGAEAHGISIEMELRDINEELVLKYVNMMKAGEKFPMPVVDFVARTQEGRHRLLAARELGREKVPVLVVDKPMPALSPGYVTKADHLFNLQAAKRLHSSELGENINAWRHETFAAADPATVRTEAFWDDFYRESSQRWSEFNVEMADFDGMIKSAIDDLDVASGARRPQRPALKIVDRELAPQDVAQLMGMRGDDITRSMLDVMTAQNDRDMFVSYVLAHVKQGDVGFNKQSVGGVYDQMVNSLQIRPENMSWVSGKRLELDAVRNDLHTLYNSKMLPDEEVAAIGRYFDDTANAVEATMHEVLPSQGIVDAELARYPKHIRDRVREIVPAEGPMDVSAGAAGGIKLDYGDVANLDSQLAHEVAHLHFQSVETKFGTSMRGRVHPDRLNELYAEAFEEFVTGKPMSLTRVPHEVRGTAMRDIDPVLVDDAITFIRGEGLRIAKAKPPEVTKPVLKSEFANYNDLRQSAMDEAHKWYYKEFTDYTNANAFDAILKSIYPFWTYESMVEDTQTLTRRGWKYWNELEVGEDVLALNPETLMSEWVPLEHVNVYDFDGEALHMKDREADFIFTKEHRWLVNSPIHRTDYFEDNIEFVASSNLVKRHKIPRRVPHKADWDSILSVHDAAVLGWLVTDGYKEKNQLLICQSKQIGKDNIMELLSVDGDVKTRDYSQYNGYFKFVIPKPCQERIEAVYGGLGDLIHIVTELSVEACEAMLETMLLGDGDRVNHFYQKPGIVMDAFQILCILVGKHGNISSRMRDNVNFESQALTIYESQYRHAVNIRPVHYRGRMWCPTTKHGTFLARRNGKVIWTGNSQRWFWLPRSFVRHPGTFTAFERWQDNTDYGYLHIPGTSVDIGFGRGTVYGTLQTRLARRDYPEYYDSLGVMSGVIEFNDFLSRYGFYPGAHIGIPMALFLGGQPQMGEIAPALIKTPLDALIATFPDSESVKWISDHVFADRFRHYMTILTVNRMGGDGSLIFSKMEENKPLTPEEEQIWADARREMGWYSAGFEQFGLFRMRTDEQHQMYEMAGKVIEEMTGFTPEQQDWIRKHGYRLWDIVGGMSPTEQAMLQEMDYYRWVGNIRPLLPGKEQEVLNQVELGWNQVEKYGDSVLRNKLRLQQEFLSGVRGPDDYNALLLETYDKQHDYILSQMEDTLLVPLPEGLTDEEREEWIETHSLMTLEGRKEYYKDSLKPMPVLHPMRELLNLYFSIDLKEVINPATGELERDWDNFWAMRQAIEQAVPDHLKQEWDDYLARNSTRLEQIRREVYHNYFRTYNKVWEKILSTYNEQEQGLIEEYLSLERTGRQLERQAEIKATVSEKTGNMLISSFRSEVSDAKQALRYHNPQLDAWLFYWGKTSTFISPTGEDAYRQLAIQTGRKI